jgi:hypothetical protein
LWTADEELSGLTGRLPSANGETTNPSAANWTLTSVGRSSHRMRHRRRSSTPGAPIRLCRSQPPFVPSSPRCLRPGRPNAGCGSRLRGCPASGARTALSAGRRSAGRARRASPTGHCPPGHGRGGPGPRRMWERGGKPGRAAAAGPARRGSGPANPNAPPGRGRPTARHGACGY